MISATAFAPLIEKAFFSCGSTDSSEMPRRLPPLLQPALAEPHSHVEQEEQEVAAPMPWISTPKVVQRDGEPQPHVQIGWADIYLDLILVGVAFNGGILLKHAFYLCHPQSTHDAIQEFIRDATRGMPHDKAAAAAGGAHHRLLDDGGAHPPDPAPALKGRRKNMCLARH